MASHIWKRIVDPEKEMNIQIFEERRQYKSICYKLLCENVISCTSQKDTDKNMEVSAIKVSNSLDADFISWVNEQGYIFDAHWDITNKCNAKCIHCYNKDAHSKDRNNLCEDELNTQEAVALLHILKNIGVFRLVFSGGESSIREDFITLCSNARKMGFQLVIYTNGIALDRKKEDLALLYPFCIAISIYGSKSSIHEHITGIKGSYCKSIKTIEYFKRKGVFTCYKNTLLKSNYQDWKEALIQGEKLADVSMINCTIYPSINNSQRNADYELNIKHLIELALQENSPIFFQDKIEKVCNVDKGPDKHPCYDATNNLYIAPNGDIYPCIAFPYRIGSFRENKIEHLKKKSIKNLLFSTNLNIESYEQRLDNWRSLKIKDLIDCGKFDYCNFCIDLCPGDAYLMSGNILAAPQNHCIIAKARFTAKYWHNSGGTLDTWKTFLKTDMCESYIKNCINYQI
jgi:radical SAM protein with 4Fe4S-binding SPASM domain